MRSSVSRTSIVAACAFATLAAAAAVWHARGYSAADILETLRLYADSPAALLAVVAMFVLAGFVFVPVMLLIAFTGLVFGPVEGAVYALLGSTASAACAYAVGHHYSYGLLKRYAGPKVVAIRKALKARGLVTIILVRMVPSGPFTLLNLVAGASSIRFRDFLLGTVIGMAPGIGLTVGLVHGLAAAWHAATMRTLGLIAACIAAAAVLAYAARRALKRRRHMMPPGA